MAITVGKQEIAQARCVAIMATTGLTELDEIIPLALSPKGIFGSLSRCQMITSAIMSIVTETGSIMLTKEGPMLMDCRLHVTPQ